MRKNNRLFFFLALALSGPLQAKASDKNPLRVWAMIKPLQCMGNAWEKAWLASHRNRDSKYPHLQEKKVIENFLIKNGVAPLDIRLSPPGGPSCASCDCARGDTLYVQVFEQDLPTMQTFGFTRVDMTKP